MEEKNAYRKIMSADQEVDKLLKKIEELLSSSSNREETEKLIFREYAPLVDKAMKKSRKAFDRWLRIIDNITLKGG